MSILINGMEMPTRCEDCFCYRHNAEYDYAYCNISSVNVLGHGNARLNNCPLVPVPEHGRLIDADALMARFEKEEKAADEHGRDFSFSFKSAGENCAEWWSVQKMLFDAPTIIPADPAEEGE